MDSQLTFSEALSGIFGDISLASWVFVLVPQLIENYRLSSADGISLPFLLIWFVGDTLNLVGALWAQLVPTIVIIAIYFCFADFVLISQTLWYRWRTRNVPSHQPEATETAVVEDEDYPLLSRHDSNVGLPGSHSRRRVRRASSSSSWKSANGMGERRRQDSTDLERVAENGDQRDSYGTVHANEEDAGEKTEDGQLSTMWALLNSQWVRNAVSLLAVCALGITYWFITWKIGFWRPAPPESLAARPNAAAIFQGHVTTTSATPVGATIVGYASAALYLLARLPQLVKNYRDKSCEGLSLLFFLLSLLGNLSYGAGILAHSLQREYVIKNIPWLLGSLGTMVEDIGVFIQFRIYGTGEEEEEKPNHSEVTFP